MKLNLESDDMTRNGYLNISAGNINPAAVHPDVEVIPGHFANLDPIVKDDTVDELIFNQPLNILSPEELVFTLNHWHKKLKNESLAKLFFIDTIEVARNIWSGDVPIDNAHAMILGSSRQFKSLCYIDKMKEALLNTNFMILTMTPTDFYVHVELKKIPNDA